MPRPDPESDLDRGLAQEEVRRWTHQLRVWMTELERSQRSIERQLGWGTGYLSQLLRPDPPDLKVKHVVAILRALGVAPERYFTGLYPALAETAEVPERDDVLRMSRDELREFVAETLRQELLHLAGGAPRAAPGAARPERPAADAEDTPPEPRSPR